MVIWKQTSLFAYKDNLTLEKIIPHIDFFGEPTPYSLVRKGIEKFSRPGERVLDPGCGNGTVGAVALEMNRQMVLSDLNQLAVQTVANIFQPVDDVDVIAAWDELARNIPLFQRESDLLWDRFLQSSLLGIPAFRLIQKKVGCLQDIFHPEDLKMVKGLYLGIEKIQPIPVRRFLRVAFDTTLLQMTQLGVNRERRSFTLMRNSEVKDPLDLIQERLELLLDYNRLIQGFISGNPDQPPEVFLASLYHLSYLEQDSVDYILFHLPGLNGPRGSGLSYLGELLRGQLTDVKEEFEIELDYRGRYRLLRDLTRMLRELDRVLKENGCLTLIFSGHYVLLSLVIRVAQNEGWHLVQGEVELVKGGLTEYPVMSVTLQKKRLHTVLGALNKMKVETLYDTEEAILRKIDQFLTEVGMATLEEIQQYLIENYLHDCLIEKPLETLLEENYLWSGKYWLKSPDEQKADLLRKRGEAMQKAFPEFIREMVYSFLREEETVLSYDVLINRFLQIRPRGVFHTPYYRLLVEQCDHTGVKLHQLIQIYFEELRKDPFETLAQVLRRIIRTDHIFCEVVPGELVGLQEWPDDLFFKIFLELFEKARRNPALLHYQGIGKKALELLPRVTYLDDRKKERIREYILRSENL